MTTHPSPAGHPGRDQRLLKQSRDSFLPVISQAFALAVARFDDVLFDRAELAATSQLLFLDGMRELRRRREEIVARFRNQLDVAWRALEQGTPLSADAALAGLDGASSLSLVPEDELESRLAVRNLAGVLLREWKQVLDRIDRRLGWIATADGVELDADHNPIGPEHIGVAIHEAFASSELAPEVRLLLIKLCERELSQPIGKLYLQLDQMLANAGVRPELSRRPSRSVPSRTDATAAARAHAVVPVDPQAPAWASYFLGRWIQSRGRTPAAPRGHGAGDATADETGEYPGGDQGMLLEALHELLQQARSVRENAASAASVAVAQQRPLNQREMMSLLSLLQAMPSAGLRSAVSDDDDSFAQRLKSDVLSSATRLGVDPANARLDPMDEDAIDLVGMLFDVMLDERDLEGRSRELIGRLTVPFVKVAMLDRKLFVQQSHPARRLLDALAEACEGNAADSPAERLLMSKVEEVVDRLVAEFNENLAIFLTLEEEFRDFLGQHRRRVEIAERRAAETQRGQEKLELARTRASTELRERLARGPLPRAVEDFLHQPWLHHLTMSILRDGEDGAGVAAALGLADGLLAEVSEARAHVVGKPWLQPWLPELQRVFASVGLHGDTALGVIGALRDTLQAIAEARPELERPLPELPRVSLPSPPAATEGASSEHGAGIQAGDFDPADADRLRHTRIGTWFDFVDKDGKVQAGKLSWISPVSSRLLFVNRRGVRFCVASPEELAARLRSGRLRAHVNDGAFDSAMQGVIDRLDPFGNDAP